MRCRGRFNHGCELFVGKIFFAVREAGRKGEFLLIPIFSVILFRPTQPAQPY